MATKTIKGSRDGNIVIKQSHTTIIVDENATINPGKFDPSGGSPTALIMEDMSKTPVPSHNKIIVNGDLISYGIGVLSGGANDSITIGKTSTVAAAVGVYAVGKNAHVENRGHIVSAGSGSQPGAIAVIGDNGHVRNDGLIEGLAGIYAGGNDISVINGTHGVIRAMVYGVAVESAAGEKSSFTNDGKILVTLTNTGSPLYAFNSTAGNDTVTNHGTMTGMLALGEGNDRLINSGRITGDADLGGGNDMFDNRGGHMTGSIIGGAGNDTLITDNAKLVLFEESSGGTDTVKSTVSYKLTDNVENLVLLGNTNINGTGQDMTDNKLVGNAGNNTLKGLSGADDLSGGKGNDVLWGGANADTFHFSKGGGHDTIADFSQAEADVIDLSHWTGMTNLTAVQTHAQDQGDDVLITLGHDTLLIRNIHEAELAGADFVYSAT